MNNGQLQNFTEVGKELDKGKQFVVMDTNSKPAKVRYDHRYPEPLAKYQDVVEDRRLFMDTLGKLHAAMSTKFMIPIIGGKELDLHQLFVEVTSRGGIEKVIRDRKWKEITAAFNFPSTATNASFVLRKYYMSLLHHYEQLYFFRSQGWNSPPTASSNSPSATSEPTEKLAEPILRNCSSVPSVRKCKGNGELAPAVPPGPAAPANRMVSGVIDGKCEHGYLVTVMVGTQKLRGVLFHPVEETSNQAANVSTNAENSNVRVTSRRRHRKKLSKRDPTHPKPNRSGYNFFFAEQHARLRPLHPGRDREISKIIGDLWNNLTEAEKAVYQERGVQDKERYRTEMAVYRERQKTGLVICDAVPIRQHPAEPVGANPVGGMVSLDSKMGIDEMELPEGDENDSGSDDSSGTEGNDSDEDSDLETSPDVGQVTIESSSLAGGPSAEGEGFELRRRDELQVGAEAEVERPSSGKGV